MHYSITEVSLGNVGNEQIGRDPPNPLTDFKRNFIALILAGKSIEADDLLSNSKKLHKQLRLSRAFDALLEEMLEITNKVENSTEQYTKTIILCRIIEKENFDSQFSSLCEAACLLAIGKKNQAEDLLRRENLPLGAVNEWITLYQHFPKSAMVNLFIKLYDFMQTLLIKEIF